MSNFILEVKNTVFFEGVGGETGELRDPEKDSGTKARSNNKHYSHVAPCQNRTVAIGGNCTRRALSRLRHPCSRRNVFIILIAFSSYLCVDWEK